MGTIWKVLTRKKVIDPVTAEDSQLARRLNTFDLTALGVGSTLGVGVYVLAGHVAKTVAGPSVVLSFLLAAVASVFAGLCYAEFGARAPRAGSAYIYSYVCVGEFIAFIIGWNLILEYVIGSASVAKGLSLYLDNLLNNTLQNTFTEIAPINLPFMAKYFDFFSCGISILLAVALAFGLKESSWANNIFTTLNIGVVLFVIVAGSLKADTANWHLAGNSTNSTIGNGGFFPFGIEGTIKGAATCFYGFVGFDCIATTGEEAKNPKKAIPLSIVLSLLIIFLAYFGISTVVTLMVPYYLQNPDAPIPYAFEHIGWNWAKWIVSIGGIFGLCASLFGAMFPLPRIIYAMATDSLVFKFLGQVHNRFQTPVIGTLIAGTLTGLMAALFELNQLVNMMSIGTLMAYTIVAASVLLLRFSMDDNRIAYIAVRNNSESEDSEPYSDNISTFNVNTNVDEDNSLLDQNSYGEGSAVGQIFNCGRYAEPTKISQRIVAVEVFLYCLTCVLIGLSAIYLKHPILNGDIWAIVLTSVVIFIAALLLMSIATQPVSRKELSFKVPMVPLIPALSILANIYLMLMLDFHTWIRFAVWMAIGLPIYYFSVRMIDNEPEIKKPVVENKLNGNLNYYVNNGYVDDLSLNKEMKTKKKPAPQPPKSPQKSIDKMEVNEIMEQFDEILEEAANTLERNNRKRSSAGSISVSDVASHEENVVADVHCDVDIPATPEFPSENPIENVEVQNKENQSVSTEDNSIKENEVIVSNEDTNINEPKVEKIKPTLPPLTLTNVSDSSSQTNLTVPLDRPVSFISTTSSSPEYVETIPNLTSAITSVTNIPLPPPLPPIELAETKTIPIEQTVNTPSFQRKNTRETLRRVSSDTLKEVTLRPTRKRVENNKEEYKPDDDNLKVNSDKAKSFIENLSTKLTRPNMMPSYIVPTKGIAPRPPSKFEKNENVIEENINKDEAKEKLGLFVNSRVSIIKPNKVKETPTPIQDNTITQEKNEESEDSAYLAHKNRMKNVFRSMKIPDASKEPIPTQRNSLTLEHKIDENKQRQAMKQISESIQLRRKESTQQFSEL